MIIQKLAAQKLGIKLSDEQAEEILKKMGPLLNLAGCSSVEAFAKQLESSHTSSSYEQFVGLVTNNETYFFREPHHFAFIGENIVGPHLVKSTSNNVTFRFISLGCANGAEPYSIAMTMYDFLKKISSWSCEIQALDVNPYNIQTAKQATYHPYSFRQPLLDAEYQEKFFTKVGGHWLLNPEIREMVKFKSSNFKEEDFGKGWEGITNAVFMRNVSMYFDDATRKRVFTRIAELLSDTGYFIVASQEVYSIPSTLFTSIHTKSGFVFVKAGFSLNESGSVDIAAETKKWQNKVNLTKITKSMSGRRKFEVKSKIVKGSKDLETNKVDKTSNLQVNTSSLLAKAKISRAIELFDNEDFTGSRALLNDILKLERNDPYYWLLKAHLDLNANDLLVAWEAAIHAVQIDSLLPEGYFVLGLIHKAREELVESEEMFRKALFLAADFWPARVFLGDILRRRGQRNAALTQYRLALASISPKLPTPLYLETWKNMVEGIARAGISILDEESSNRA